MNNTIPPKDAAEFLRALSTNLESTEKGGAPRGVEQPDVDRALEATFKQLGIDPAIRDGFESLVKSTLGGQGLSALPREALRRAEFLETNNVVPLPEAARNILAGVNSALELDFHLIGGDHATKPILYSPSGADPGMLKDLVGDMPTGSLTQMIHRSSATSDDQIGDGHSGSTHMGWFDPSWPQDYGELIDQGYRSVSFETPSTSAKPLDVVDLILQASVAFGFPSDYRAAPLEATASPEDKAAKTLVDLHLSIAGKSSPPTAKLVAYSQALQQLFDLPELKPPEFARLKGLLSNKRSRSLDGFTDVLRAFVSKAGAGLGDRRGPTAMSIAMAVQGRFD